MNFTGQLIQNSDSFDEKCLLNLTISEALKTKGIDTI